MDADTFGLMLTLLFASAVAFGVAEGSRKLGIWSFDDIKRLVKFRK